MPTKPQSAAEVVFSLRLNKLTLKRLKDIARDDGGRTAQSVARKAIEEYIKRDGGSNG